MRVTEERIQLLATAVVERLQEQGLLEIAGSKERLIDAIRKAITDELSWKTGSSRNSGLVETM